MHKHFAHLLMIGIIITCPIRCLVAGCGSFGALADETSAITQNCCCQEKSLPATDDLPADPCPKCQCKCFCSGVTVADCFEVQADTHWEPMLTFVSRIDVLPESKKWLNRPPDYLGSYGSENIGRAIRNQHSSLLN